VGRTNQGQFFICLINLFAKDSIVKLPTFILVRVSLLCQIIHYYDRPIWEDNIKMDIKGTDFEDVVYSSV